jgi:hypothetical protein
MARRRQANVDDVDEVDERAARMRARHAYHRGRFHPMVGPHLAALEGTLHRLSGLELLDAVTAAFDAAGVAMPAVWPRVRRPG